MDKSTEALGTKVSFESYRLPWANASNTPFRFYKHWVHEGGISTPLIVHWPEGIHAAGEFRNDPASLPDIMATIIELSGAIYPKEFSGNNILPNEGLSLIPTFHGNNLKERSLFWEHEANRAIRRGKWKLVSAGMTEYPFTGPWELYDMEQDRTEIHNLADEYPELVNEMVTLWEEWADNHMVHPLDGRDWGTRADNPIFIHE